MALARISSMAGSVLFNGKHDAPTWTWTVAEMNARWWQKLVRTFLKRYKKRTDEARCEEQWLRGGRRCRTKCFRYREDSCITLATGRFRLCGDAHATTHPEMQNIYCNGPNKSLFESEIRGGERDWYRSVYQFNTLVIGQVSSIDVREGDTRVLLCNSLFASPFLDCRCRYGIGRGTQ
jgi:hypothetical protein